MNERPASSRIRFRRIAYSPELGCLLLSVVLLLLLMAPFVFIGFISDALEKLHLHRGLSLLVMLGVFLGGFVNIPLRRIERQFDQIIPVSRLRSWLGWVPVVKRRRSETIIAVNVGGCLIPVALAVYQLFFILPSEWGSRALAIVVGLNIFVCWWVARPTPGVGITMPALTSPLVCVLAAYILLPPSSDFATLRAPVAFMAGVMGPVVGADLLHLRDLQKVSVGVLSIGGAGTFDGIVLSGLLAAMLA